MYTTRALALPPQDNDRQADRCRPATAILLLSLSASFVRQKGTLKRVGNGPLIGQYCLCVCCSTASKEITFSESIMINPENSLKFFTHNCLRKHLGQPPREENDNGSHSRADPNCQNELWLGCSHRPSKRERALVSPEEGNKRQRRSFQFEEKPPDG